MAEGSNGTAEENNATMPDVPDADTPIPPIDNIHAPGPEPETDLRAAYSQEPSLRPFYASEDTEMSGAAVRPAKPPYIQQSGPNC